MSSHLGSCMVPCQFKRPCDKKRRGYRSDYGTRAADLSEIGIETNMQSE